jgi:hypothetical protein
VRRITGWAWARWEHELQRLRALGVKMTELHAVSASFLFKRFATEFVDPERAGEMLDDAPPARPREATLDFERWTRSECTERARAEGSLLWLRAGHFDARCVRLERRRHLPAIEIDVATMEDAWATSWPGAFVNFDRARALLISTDYEAFRCDLRRLRSTPYR